MKRQDSGKGVRNTFCLNLIAGVCFLICSLGFPPYVKAEVKGEKNEERVTKGEEDIVNGEEKGKGEEGKKGEDAPIAGLKKGLIWEGDTYRLRIWGEVENLISLYQLDEASLLNPNNLFQATRWRNDTQATLKLDANIKERVGVFARGRIRNEYKENKGSENRYRDNLDQAYATLKVGDEIITFVSIGKQRIKWGTGIYWNPVDTFNPRQDLQDREKTGEGKVCYQVDVAFPSFSLTGVVVPNVESRTLSADNFSLQGDKTLLTAKLYTFLWNTDLTLYVSHRQKEDTRWGASFSTVISDIQFFGEGVFWQGEGERSYLYRASQRTPAFDPIGNTNFTIPAAYGTKKKDRSFFKSLLGMQYTFANDLTLIVEYYHNQDGYDNEEMDAYIDFLKYAGGAYEGDVNTVLLAKNRNPSLPLPNYHSKVTLLSLGNGLYDFANLRKNYLHTSLSKPYVANRFHLGLNIIINIDDYIEKRGKSGFFRPSITYTAKPNWNFTLYSQLYLGANDTEFGMLAYDYGVFGVIKYFF